MKKLLATTAMCLVFSTGLHSMASANETVVTAEYNAKDYVKPNNAERLLLVEPSMYRGDFQQISRSIIGERMYAGHGSVKMASIQSVRY